MLNGWQLYITVHEVDRKFTFLSHRFLSWSSYTNHYFSTFCIVYSHRQQNLFMISFYFCKLLFTRVQFWLR
jgi:hypothetical protein